MWDNDRQVNNHQKESNCIAAMEQYFKEHHVPFRRATLDEDIHNGIDVFIARRGYDLKVTNQPWIDYQKDLYSDGMFTGTEYPLLKHPDIPLLICRQTDNGYNCYQISKSSLSQFRYDFERSRPDLFKDIDQRSSGDGHYHHCVNITAYLQQPTFIITEGFQSVASRIFGGNN